MHLGNWMMISGVVLVLSSLKESANLLTEFLAKAIQIISGIIFLFSFIVLIYCLSIGI